MSLQMCSTSVLVEKAATFERLFVVPISVSSDGVDATTRTPVPSLSPINGVSVHGKASLMDVPVPRITTWVIYQLLPSFHFQALLLFSPSFISNFKLL